MDQHNGSRRGTTAHSNGGFSSGTPYQAHNSSNGVPGHGASPVSVQVRQEPSLGPTLTSQPHHPAHMTGPGGFIPTAAATAAAGHATGSSHDSVDPWQDQDTQNRFYGDGTVTGAAPTDPTPTDPTPVYPSRMTAPAGYSNAYAGSMQVAYGAQTSGFGGGEMPPPGSNTAPKRTMWPRYAIAALLLVGCAAGGLAAYEKFSPSGPSLLSGINLGGLGAQTASIPTLYPPTTPERDFPENTGGLIIPDRDKVLLNDSDLQSGPELLRPAPEQPMALDAVQIGLGNERDRGQSARPTQLQDPFADLLQPSLTEGTLTPNLPTVPAPRPGSAAITPPAAPARAVSPTPAASTNVPVQAPDIGSFLKEIENDSSSLTVPSDAGAAPLPALFEPLARVVDLAPVDQRLELNLQAKELSGEEFAQLSLDSFEQPVWDLDATAFQPETAFLPETSAPAISEEQLLLPGFDRETAFAREDEWNSEQNDNTVAERTAVARLEQLPAAPISSTQAAPQFRFQSMGFNWNDALDAPSSTGSRLTNDLASLLPGDSPSPAPFSDSDFDPFGPLTSVASRESNLIPQVAPPAFGTLESADSNQFAQLSLDGGTPNPVGIDSGLAPLPQLVEDVDADINRFNELSAQDPLMLQPNGAMVPQQPQIDPVALEAARAQAASNAAPLDGPFGDAPIPFRPTPPALNPAQAIAPYGIQLGSLRSEADARGLWARLQGKHVELLGDMLLDVQQVSVKGKRYHRVQAGPVPNRATAADLCALLKAERQDCIVVKR